MTHLNNTLKNLDQELFNIMEQERIRQEEHIELIASENYVSKAVMEAQGSVLTNKYAEGYPKKRYYGGCQYVDQVEQLAIDRAKKLFGAEYANVQPHSGSQANQAVYFAVLKPGDTVLGMSLAHGGHLTHGSPVNLSGKLFLLIVILANPNTSSAVLPVIPLGRKSTNITCDSVRPDTIRSPRFTNVSAKVTAFDFTCI